MHFACTPKHNKRHQQLKFHLKNTCTYIKPGAHCKKIMSGNRQHILIDFTRFTDDWSVTVTRAAVNVCMHKTIQITCRMCWSSHYLNRRQENHLRMICSNNGENILQFLK